MFWLDSSKRNMEDISIYVWLIYSYNDLFSDGIPIRAGDDIDGDEDEEELQYEWSTEGEREIVEGEIQPEWSTEGEREIEPERDSPPNDQVCVWGWGGLISSFLRILIFLYFSLDSHITIQKVKTDHNQNRSCYQSSLTSLSISSSSWSRRTKSKLIIIQAGASTNPVWPRSLSISSSS